MNRGRRWNRFSTRKRKPRVPTYVLSQLLLTVHSTYRGGLESIFPCSGRVVSHPEVMARSEVTGLNFRIARYTTRNRLKCDCQRGTSFAFSAYIAL